jgi:hypothetical protein
MAQGERNKDQERGDKDAGERMRQGSQRPDRKRERSRQQGGEDAPRERGREQDDER